MGRVALLALAMVSAGCLLEHPPRIDPLGAAVETRRFALGGGAIDVWLHPHPGPAPLVLLLTGDGGWRGADRTLFDGLMGRGYPLAGVRAPSYLEHLEWEPAPAHRVADDLASLIEDSVAALGLEPRHPVVLVGFSRGAGLAIAATARGELRREIALAGVVAVGLADREEYVRHRSPYQRIGELGTLPVAVIQATHDGYLRARDARALFGPDGPSRRFVAIEARNHTFSDARPALEASVAEAIAWIGSAR